MLDCSKSVNKNKSICAKSNSDKKLRPLLCYTGGKTKMADRIIKRIPPHRVYIEGFVGGASVFFAKPLAEKNVLNDKKIELIEFYKKFRNSKYKSINKCNLPRSRMAFDEALKNKNKNVCSFLGVNKRSYGCSGEHFAEATAKDPKRGKPKIGLTHVTLHHQDYKNKLNKAILLNKDYKQIVNQYSNKDSFTYLDPPYYDTYDYGLPRVNPVDVCDTAKKIKGKVLISYNNHPFVRRACKGLKIRKISTSYELQRNQTGKSKPVKELLISNY